MTTHRYDRSAIGWDYARGGFGLLLTGGPALSVPMVSWLGIVFGGLGTLFAVYLARTWLRGVTVVEVDVTGIRTVGPLGRAIAWDQLAAMDLRYFATRRDKEGGWMQMKLQGGGRAIALESSLQDFAIVAERAAAAAARNRLALSEVTRENLRALGLAAGAGVPVGTAPEGPVPARTGPVQDDRVGTE